MCSAASNRQSLDVLAEDPSPTTDELCTERVTRAGTALVPVGAVDGVAVEEHRSASRDRDHVVLGGKGIDLAGDDRLHPASPRAVVVWEIVPHLHVLFRITR